MGVVGDGGREIFNIFLFLGYLKSLNNNVSQYFIGEIFNIFLFLGYLKSLNNNVSQYFILLQGIKIYKSY